MVSSSSSIAIVTLLLFSLSYPLTSRTQSPQPQSQSASPNMVRKTESELRSEAITRIEPTYPPLAKAARVFGTVVVEVTIDEEGAVISARAIMGHPLLKDASCTAARGWKFNPTQIGGKPVRVIGTISFDFNLGSHDAQSGNSEAEAEKQPLMTLREQQRLRLAKEAADRFIQRWHETLDFQFLFNELYVLDPTQRRRNIYFFVSTAPNNDKVREAKNLDAALVQEGFIAFFNMYYLGQEYPLSLQRPGQGKEDTTPPEIVKAEKALRAGDGKGNHLTPDRIREFIVKANYLSSLYRKYLTREVLESATYKANVAEYSKHSDSARITHGWPEFNVEKVIDVYNVRRGIFDFYFIEESGQLRVLTLGFEL